MRDFSAKSGVFTVVLRSRSRLFVLGLQTAHPALLVNMSSTAAGPSRACCFTILLALGQAVKADSALVSAAPAVKATFDLSKGHAMADKLWGVFFEEVGTASKLDRLAVKHFRLRRTSRLLARGATHRLAGCRSSTRATEVYMRS